jgi:UDP-2,3-diacylglucosamine hydrolase
VPTIGRGTLETMLQAGASVLAVEARKTILLDQADVISFADQHKLVIVSLPEDGENLEP